MVVNTIFFVQEKVMLVSNENHTAYIASKIMARDTKNRFALKLPANHQTRSLYKHGTFLCSTEDTGIAQS